MLPIITNKDTERSEIVKFFTGKTVFITGTTGVLGKLLLEKLLRTCKEIKMVYVLIRPKRGKSVENRFEEMLASVVFDRIKTEYPKFSEKISLIPGDCILPNLGLNEEDAAKLIQEVNCVFHCAATIRFNQKLRTVAYINVRSTRDILVLSKQMKNLHSFVYVSTAYANCIDEQTKEEFHESPIPCEKLLTLIETLSDDLLNKITPMLLEKWPNTYNYCKAVAEGVVKSEGKGLPVAVVRPSSVVSTVEEPVPGWINNYYGPTGLATFINIGGIRTMHCNLDHVAEMVPADFVVNCIIAAAWDINNKRVLVNNNKEKENGDITTIYNYVCANEGPITWRDYLKCTGKHFLSIPSILMIWYPYVVTTSSHFLCIIYTFFLMGIPAYIADLWFFCCRKETRAVKGYQKSCRYTKAYAFFINRLWNFKTDNTQKLWKKLNREDQKLFHFTMKAFDWDSYAYTCAKGTRMYILKDPLDTIPQGRSKYLKLKIVHFVLMGSFIFGSVMVLIILWLLYCRFYC